MTTVDRFMAASYDPAMSDPMMEGIAVLREVFAAYDVVTVGADEPKVRNITSVPRKGAKVRVLRR